MDIYEILQTTDAKINFLKGLIRIAKCDGKVDETERIYFEQMAKSLGVDEPKLPMLNEFWNENEYLCVQFSSQREKNFFLIQAIQLCWVDGGYSEVEKNEIRKITKELAVSVEVLEAIEEWAYEGILWNRKSENLLNMR